MKRSTIDKIVWWIPFNKIRNSVREYLFSKFCLEIPQVEACITTKCTLRCIDCVNLNTHYYIPKYNKTPDDSNIDDIIENLKLFLKKINNLAHLIIIGGEPFMHKELCKLVNFASANKKIHFINIYTNGTLIPTGDNLNCLKNIKVDVQINDYGSISTKKNELIETLKNEDIKFTFHDKDSGDARWVDGGDIYCRNRTIDELKDAFAHCGARPCKHILNDKLYGCPRLAHAYNLGIYELKGSEFIDLNTKDKNLRKKIRDLYFNTEYYNFCNYCDVSSKYYKLVKPAIQLEQK